MPRGIPNRKPPSTSIDDDDDAGQPVRSHVQAGSQPPPATNAASSVFALGARSKSAPVPRGTRFDFAAVVIKSKVPVPPAEVGGVSPYSKLLERMKPGDMVELPLRQAYGLQSMAKKLKIATARRKLGDDTYGVWRQS